MHVVLVNIGNLVYGDTVEHDGLISTVSKQNYKYDPFMEWCLYGDSYCLGQKPVKKILFRK